MSRRKVIVKQLNAIQNFGAMDILCSDKTGTLTQDKIVLERYLDIHGTESLLVLQYAYLNSYYQTGLKNLLDRAILQHVEVEAQLQPAEVLNIYTPGRRSRTTGRPEWRPAGRTQAPCHAAP